MEFPWYLVAELAALWGGSHGRRQGPLAGEVSLIARGNDFQPLVRNQTMRVNVANAKFLARHRADVLGFLEAYKKSARLGLFNAGCGCRPTAKLSDQSVEFAKYIVKEFASKASNQLDEIKR